MFLELTYWPTEKKSLVNVNRIVSIRPHAYSGTMIDFAGAPSFHASEDYDSVRAMIPPQARPIVSSNRPPEV